jgi:hypothetical protein
MIATPIIVGQAHRLPPFPHQLHNEDPADAHSNCLQKRGRKQRPPDSKPERRWLSQHLNISTAQHLNISTSQHLNISTAQLPNCSTAQLPNFPFQLLVAPKPCAKPKPAALLANIAGQLSLMSDDVVIHHLGLAIQTAHRLHHRFARASHYYTSAEKAPRLHPSLIASDFRSRFSVSIVRSEPPSPIIT